MRLNLSLSFLSCLLLLVMTPAQAEPLDQRLERTMDGLSRHYAGHESVRVENDATPRKYLLLDFRYPSKPEGDRLQSRVHRICMAVLRNRELVSELSEAGYDMISVAFDRHHQYDCLP